MSGKEKKCVFFCFKENLNKFAFRFVVSDIFFPAEFHFKFDFRSQNVFILFSEILNDVSDKCFLFSSLSFRFSNSFRAKLQL